MPFWCASATVYNHQDHADCPEGMLHILVAVTTIFMIVHILVAAIASIIALLMILVAFILLLSSFALS